MELSEYKEAAISYIAGYVVKMVEKKIHCPQCPDLFVTWKTNGGLKLPSLGLIKICEETECNENAKCKWRCKCKCTLDQHMFDSTPGNNHVFKLIKCCCQSYVTIRMHHLSKTRNAGMHEKVVREQFSKLVLVF